MFAGAGRREIHWKGGYREVVQPERLCPPSPMSREDADELITVLLIDLGDGRTEMLFQQRGRMSAE